MPVPIMFAITMHVAVSREMRCGVFAVDISYFAVISHAVATALSRRATEIAAPWQSGAATTHVMLDVRRMAAKPHLLLASVQDALVSEDLRSDGEQPAGSS